MPSSVAWARFEEQFQRKLPPPGEIAHSLSRMFSGYDTSHLVATFGALQLIPSNGHLIVRLENLACAAAATPTEPSGQRAGHLTIDRLCNQAPVAELAWLDDPPTGPFTVEIPTDLGPTPIVRGLRPDDLYTYQRLLEAVLQNPESPFPEPFVDWVQDFARAFAALHHAMNQEGDLEPRPIPHKATEIRMVGEGRYPLLLPIGDNEIEVPAQEELDRLRRHVRFSDDRWREICEWAKVEVDALQEITVDLGEIDQLPRTQLCGGELMWHPIVRDASHRTVANPAALSTAAIHAIIRKAIAFDVKETLVRAVVEAFHGKIVSDFIAIGNFPHPELELPDHSTPSQGWIADHILAVDLDKGLYVLCIPDPLQDYDSEDPLAPPEAPSYPKLLDSRLSQVNEYLEDSTPGKVEARLVILGQPMGRAFRMVPPSEDHELIPEWVMFSGRDIELIAALEPNDPLFLFRYIDGRARASQEAGFDPVMDEIDIFGLYWESGRRFPWEKLPEGMHLETTPIYVDFLNNEKRTSKNPHWLEGPARLVLQRVSAVHGTSEIPVYEEEGKLGEAPAQVVEELPVPVWVIPADRIVSKGANSSGFLTEILSYWIWQFTPFLSTLEGWEDLEVPNVLVVVDIKNPGAWESWEITDIPSYEETREAITVRPGGLQGSLHVELDAPVAHLLSWPNNWGERILMAHVLHGLHKLLSDTSIPEDDSGLRDAIDRHAPLGPKSVATIGPTPGTPPLDSRFMRPFRPIMHEAATWVDRIVREHILEEIGISPGDTTKEEIQQALHTVVGRLFHEFEDRVQRVDATAGLLAYLLGLLEPVIGRQIQLDHSPKTSTHLFPEEPDAVHHYIEQTKRLGASAVALRFIIEYVTASPPQGDELYTFDLHDKLVALTFRMIEYGAMSDAINHGQASKLKMTRSGQLVLEDWTFPGLQMAQGRHRYASGKEEADEAVPLINEFTFAESPPPSNLETPFDEAAEEDYGVRISDLIGLMREGIDLGLEGDGSVRTFSRGDFVETASSNLGWPSWKVEAGLDALSLGPRESFFDPPEPFDSSDVRPWLHNRRLSLLQRPFVIEKRDDEEYVHFGHRFLAQAVTYLVRLIRGGRLRGLDEDRWNEARGVVANRRGGRFQRKMERLLERSPYKVHAQVKLREGGRDLGDLDLVVVDSLKRTMFLIECKAYVARLSPRTFQNELAKLFGSDQGRGGAMGKHERRIQWARENTDELQKKLGRSGGSWEIKGLFVLERSILTRYMQETPVPVITYDEFRQAVEGRNLGSLSDQQNDWRRTSPSIEDLTR